MKIRSGFVSNSSSSSFVLVTNTKNSNVKVKVEFDMSGFIDKTLSTIEELQDWFLEYHDYDIQDSTFDELLEEVDEYEKEQYKKYKAHIDKGFSVHLGDLDQHEYPSLINNLNNDMKNYNGNLEEVETWY